MTGPILGDPSGASERARADCAVCRSNSGEERISPGPTIYQGRGWLVEHAYPTGLLGWLVIVLARHAEALHELSIDEAAELGRLQWAVSRVLSAERGSLKEYSVFFAETPGFAHVHLHMVPRAPDLPDELRGGRVFALLGVPEGDIVPPDEVAGFCERSGAALRALLSGSE